MVKQQQVHFLSLTGSIVVGSGLTLTCSTGVKFKGWAGTGVLDSAEATGLCIFDLFRYPNSEPTESKCRPFWKKTFCLELGFFLGLDLTL